jgi:hypothetical protein
VQRNPVQVRSQTFNKPLQYHDYTYSSTRYEIPQGVTVLALSFPSKYLSIFIPLCALIPKADSSVKVQIECCVSRDFLVKGRYRVSCTYLVKADTIFRVLRKWEACSDRSLFVRPQFIPPRGHGLPPR